MRKRRRKSRGYGGDARPLTTSIDNLTGGDGNDTFNAPLVTTQFNENNVNTLNSGDQVNGGGGENTLNAVLNNGLAPANVVTPALTNVQNVNVQSVTASNLDLSASTGVEQININGVVAATNVSGIKEANVAISDLKGSGSTVALNDIEGRDFTLGLNNVGAAGAANRTVDVQLDAASVQTLTIDNGDAASFVTLANSTLTGLRTVEATGDGNLNVNLSTAAALRDVTTGAGDDKVVVGNGTFTALAGNIDLGEGNNTLVVDNAALAVNLSQNALNATNPREIAELNGVSTLELKNNAGFASSVDTVALKDSGVDSLVLNGKLTANNVTLEDAAKSFTLGLENNATTVTNATTGTPGSSAVTGQVVFADDGTATGVKTENLTLNVKGGQGQANTIDVSGNITGGVPIVNGLASLSAVDLKTLTINDTAKDGGIVEVTLDATSSNAGLRTINLSGAENTQMKIGAASIDISTTPIQNPATVTIGELDTLEYSGLQATSTKLVGEVFKFTDASFSKVTINTFDSESSTQETIKLANDKIDLSAFGITSSDDLNTAFIDASGAVVTTSATAAGVSITAKDNQFDGEIVLVGGANLTAALLGFDLSNDNFIFA